MSCRSSHLSSVGSRGEECSPFPCALAGICSSQEHEAEHLLLPTVAGLHKATCITSVSAVRGSVPDEGSMGFVPHSRSVSGCSSVPSMPRAGSVLSPVFPAPCSQHPSHCALHSLAHLTAQVAYPHPLASTVLCVLGEALLFPPLKAQRAAEWELGEVDSSWQRGGNAVRHEGRNFFPQSSLSRVRTLNYRRVITSGWDPRPCKMISSW